MVALNILDADVRAVHKAINGMIKPTIVYLRYLLVAYFVDVETLVGYLYYLTTVFSINDRR